MSFRTATKARTGFVICRGSTRPGGSREVHSGCTNRSLGGCCQIGTAVEKCNRVAQIPLRKLGQYAVTAHTLAYARGDGRGKVHPGCTAFGSRGLAEPRVRKVRTGAGAVILQLFLRFLGVIV